MAHFSNKQRSRWCDECNRYRLAERQWPNVTLHLLMSLITCGLWFIAVTIPVQLMGIYRCQSCGNKV